MNNIGVIGGADGTTQIVVSGSIGGPILWIFFGALALMVILYAAFYRRGKGKAVCLALAAVFCVAADQAVKFLVVNTMSPGESEPLLPPLLQLTRVHNYGAAWSSFSGARWLLIALTAAGMCAIAWLLVKIVRHPLGQWSLAIILGGGIGKRLIVRFDHCLFQHTPELGIDGVDDIPEGLIGVFPAGHDDKELIACIDDLDIVDSELSVKRHRHDGLHGTILKQLSYFDVRDLHNMAPPLL